MDLNRAIELTQRALEQGANLSSACGNVVNNDLLDMLQELAAYRAIGTVDQFSKQDYTLMGVMHAVDKWLEGDDLKKDEVNRAAIMREKTLQIVEGLQQQVNRLEEELASRPAVGFKKGDTVYEVTDDNSKIIKSVITTVGGCSYEAFSPTLHQYMQFSDNDVGRIVFSKYKDAQRFQQSRSPKNRFNQ